MNKFQFVSRYICIFCLAACLYSVSGNEARSNSSKVVSDDDATDDINRMLEFIDFCQEANLRTLAYSDSDSNTITVTFELSDSKFEDCFTYYDVFVEKQRRTVNAVKIRYVYSEGKPASVKFHNVTCGVYEVVIQPCYNDWQCARMRIRYPSAINMTSVNCLDTIRAPDTLIYNEGIEKEIIIPTAIFSALLVLAVCGLVYFLIRHRFHGRTDSESDFEAVDYGIVNGENAVVEVKKIHVYIFHYYDDENIIKARVEILRDFLVQSSYYSTVKVIDGELPEILNNPNDWLNKAFEEKAEDGGIIKIIIIDAKENNMGEDFENIIYIQAIATLYSDMCRSCTDYDTLFVARLRGIPAYSERIRRIVRGHRYSIPDHLIDLCLNLCTGSGLNLPTVEGNLRRLLLNHPINHLGMAQNV